MISHRTIKYNLKDIPTLDSEDLVKIESFYKSYSIVFSQIKNTVDIEDFLDWDEISSKGNFRNRFIKEYGKPYLEWDIPGNKAKYYRMMIGHCRQYVRSLQDKIKVSRICAFYDYDISQLSSIRGNLAADGLYPTNSLIRNICRCKKLPDKEKDIHPVIDFTHEDNQVSKVEYSGKQVKYSLRIYNEWISFTIDIPRSNIRDFTGVFSRAIIQKDKKTNDLYLRMTYEPIAHKHSFNDDLSLGIDQGKIKPITGAITSKDGSYSTELTYTKEVGKVAEKHQVLQREKDFLYKKRSQLEALLAGLDQLPRG